MYNDKQPIILSNGTSANCAASEITCTHTHAHTLYNTWYDSVGTLPETCSITHVHSSDR